MADSLTPDADSFAPDSFEEDKPAKPGALSQIGTSLGNAASGLANMALIASPVGGMSATGSPLDSPVMQFLKGGFATGPEEQRQKAVQQAQGGGSKIAATQRAIIGSIPFIGPAIEDFAYKVPERPFEAATDAALMALPFGVEKAAAGPIGESLSKFQIGALSAGKWMESMVQGIKPRASVTKFRSSLERAMPEMKAAESELGHPVQSVGDAVQAADVAMGKNWDQFSQYLDHAAKMGAIVDTTPIAEARIASLPSKLKLEDPAGYQRQVDIANQWRGPKTVAEAQKLLAETNAGVKAYYAQYPTERYAAKVNSPSVGADVVTGDVLRDLLYDKLDQLSGSSGVPRELKARYGALKETKRELMGRQNVADRQAPQNLAQQGGNLIAAEEGVNALGKVLTGRFGSAALDLGKAATAKRVANALREANTSNALVKKAFANYQPSPFGSITGANLGALPPPTPFQPAGLLEAGPIRMGAPDTSGPVPQVPNQNVPGPHTKVPRLLEAGPARPRGNPQRPMNSVVSSEPVVPQASVSMDDVARFAQQNMVSFAEAAQQLQQRGFRIATPQFGAINPMPPPPQ